MLLCSYDHLTIEKANKGIISHITKCLMSNMKTVSGEQLFLSTWRGVFPCVASFPCNGDHATRL